MLGLSLEGQNEKYANHEFVCNSLVLQ